MSFLGVAWFLNSSIVQPQILLLQNYCILEVKGVAHLVYFENKKKHPSVGPQVLFNLNFHVVISDFSEQRFAVHKWQNHVFAPEHTFERILT